MVWEGKLTGTILFLGFSGTCENATSETGKANPCVSKQHRTKFH